ncbi:MAG: response regulator [Lachnospiraceae bacterium]|nr:response regulator [Lachnospiraceae bacterium]MCM1239520.1 response regulator [Lachnospiraceae bacterium]
MIKVMLIDDEQEIRRLLHRMVEKQPDYQVVAECGSFAEAVAEFARYRPDVVFVDIDLNGEDGLNCARVLTELDPKLKVIFATAHSEYMANAFEIYAFDYLVKPFNMDRLTRTLDRIRDTLSGGRKGRWEGHTM